MRGAALLSVHGAKPGRAVRGEDGTYTAHGGQVPPPSDTLDPRYGECRRHHFACDCREAYVSEELAELTRTLDAFRAAANALLCDHVTFDLEARDPAGYAAESSRVCPCTGCQMCRVVYRQYCAPLRTMADQRADLVRAAA